MIISELLKSYEFSEDLKGRSNDGQAGAMRNIAFLPCI
jgi:hypothetical protein